MSKSILFVLLALTLVACGGADPKGGEKPGKNQGQQNQSQEPGSKTQFAQNGEVAEMKLDSGHAGFVLTAPLTQWKMNEIQWEGAKGKAVGKVSAPVVPLLSNTGRAPYRSYALGALVIAKSACDSSNELEARVVLKTIRDSRVVEEREMALEQAVSVDTSNNTYELEVQVKNTQNCGSIRLELGIKALSH